MYSFRKNQTSEAFLAKSKIEKDRASSEQKADEYKKPNYHYTQRRDMSDSSKQIESSKIPDPKPFQIRNIKKFNAQNNDHNSKEGVDFRLPDLRKYGHKPPKAPMQHQNIVRIKSGGGEKKVTMSPKKNLSPLARKTELQLSCASFSKAGFDGLKDKVNQDRDFIYCPVEGKKDQGAFGVFDGHGMEGDKVSQFLLELLKNMLIKNFGSFDFKNTFMDMHKLLLSHPSIGSQFSGSTLTLVTIKDKKIECGWVGDSRAVLGRRNQQKKFTEAVDLSVDHKPQNEIEKQRIEACGGIIDSYHGMNGQRLGPYRVWVKGTNYPGLAMSRSLGDQVAASVGVIQIPEVKVFNMNNDDQFIIIASDGVWEFISSQEVKKLYNLIIRVWISSIPIT